MKVAMDANTSLTKSPTDSDRQQKPFAMSNNTVNEFLFELLN
jgi:hypothetical protein